MVDPVAVPDRLEQAVGETERHDALDRILAQEVIDPEDLVLVQRAQDTRVQLARRLQAVTERLFDHHAAPEFVLAVLVRFLVGEFGGAELLHHGAEEPVGNGEVEDRVALRAMRLFGIAQRAADLFVQLGLGQVALDVGQFRGKPLPDRVVDVIDVELRRGVSDEAFQHVVKMVSPAFGRAGREINADQGEVVRQQFGAFKVVERWHHQTLGQIAAGTEDDHGAGVSRTRLAPRWLLDNLCGRRRPKRLGTRHRSTPVAIRVAALRPIVPDRSRGQWACSPRRSRRSPGASARRSARQAYAPRAKARAVRDDCHRQLVRQNP